LTLQASVNNKHCDGWHAPPHQQEQADDSDGNIDRTANGCLPNRVVERRSQNPNHGGIASAAIVTSRPGRKIKITATPALHPEGA
jgi:hypothetical protein